MCTAQPIVGACNTEVAKRRSVCDYRLLKYQRPLYFSPSTMYVAICAETAVYLHIACTMYTYVSATRLYVCVLGIITQTIAPNYAVKGSTRLVKWANP